MSIWEVILIGIALSMDAFAVGMTNGMAEPNMKGRKAVVIALSFGLFQFLMPLIGYYSSSVFADLVEKIAPWLSFILLALIGGNMIVGCMKERASEEKAGKTEKKQKLGWGALLGQALATSVDALAVGVSFLAVQTTSSLPLSVLWCSLIIGAITFSLSMIAVAIGKKAGNKLSGRAEIVGGVILIAIGLKILIESFL